MSQEPRTEKVTQNECKKCNYVWWPKNPDSPKPKNCPRCKNPNWDVDKQLPRYMREDR